MKKKILIGLFALVIAFLAYQRIFHGEEIDKRNAERLAETIKEDSLQQAEMVENVPAPNKDKALTEIKKEPKVLDAVITESNVLYASVKDDGTRRDGYAEYLCQVLKDNGLTNVRVKIVKYNSSKDAKRDNAYGVLLGQSDCQ
ncbi:hypothetical protein P1X15_07335 [Runella sp. MFBS21]|uniref:hypothetical protein n=1 Tax=Runella sp. MFBS21 TaxID=3034018 RepID=UPI0023F659F4|nr:hypothetical protein [Runella sp. MFBS21]MDF7817400.1 hypothetical protein [Runella sp. MFBS21]